MKPVRADYLAKKWVKYPSITDVKHAGRVVEIEPRSVLLFAGVKTVLVTHKEIRNWDQMSAVLIPGDVVSINKAGVCTLLAPWRSQRLKDYDEQEARVIIKKMRLQQNWNQFISGIGEFFAKHKFLPVQTSTLVDNPGPEPTIDVFKTQFKEGKESRGKYLITSPELSLKKLVSQTLTPLFEITKVYRNNENSAKHAPEFWMLEWYRPFANLSTVAQDVEDLILFLRQYLSLKMKAPAFQHTSFQKILKEHYAFLFTPDSSASDLKKCLTQNQVYFSESLSLDDLFSLVNLELVEPQLGAQDVVFLNRYPPYAAALAKLDQDGWAERFEVYWKGLEIGNAFHELNDPDIQLQRLIEDNKKKLENGLEALPLDMEFIESLNRGLPPTAGISIGLERLFMALYDEPDIKNLKWI
ncbi:MAG: EF-P lysine aminoacylase GenX [Bdellovibrionaceae bacterium]|nr:EF-P lysine aminoacylase GenX [Pseudobdellovibrionaceae bacterium]